MQLCRNPSSRVFARVLLTFFPLPPTLTCCCVEVGGDRRWPGRGVRGVCTSGHYSFGGVHSQQCSGLTPDCGAQGSVLAGFWVPRIEPGAMQVPFPLFLSFVPCCEETHILLPPTTFASFLLECVCVRGEADPLPGACVFVLISSPGDSLDQPPGPRAIWG